MKPQHRLLLCFLPLITVITVTNVVLASCPMTSYGPPCQEFWRAEAVFIGVADRVVRTPNNEPGLAIGPYVKSTVYFTIEEAFKGVSGTALVLDLDHCGYLFNEKEQYLVYAYQSPNNKRLDVRVGSTRTRPISEAKEDLDYIRGLSTAESGSRVYGKVTKHTYNVKKNGYDTESLENIRVRLEENGEPKEVVTDGEGRYEFKGVSAGTYRIRAELPAYLSPFDEAFKITDRECAPIDIRVWPKAQIAGRVLDVNGKPIASIPVSLVSADASPEEILVERKNMGAWRYTLTDSQGRFKFSHLPPGRYLLIVNRAEYEKSQAKNWSAVPRLFYPGVNDLAAATVIVVSNDQEAQEYNFHLPLGL